MPTIDDLRAALGAAASGRTDEELLSAYSRGNKLAPGAVADTFGYKPTNNGMRGNRWAAAIDDFQGNMYGIAEAVGAGDWARRGRASNEYEAAVSRERARNQGAVQSWDDVKIGDNFLNYAEGLAIDSAPTMGTILAGTAAGAMTGGFGAVPLLARLGYGLNAARAASVASGVGGFAGGYTAALGDTLSNQRDEKGTTDLLTAAAAALPYAAVDTFTGAGGKLVGLARRGGAEAVEGTARRAIGDTWKGVPGWFGRVGVNALKTGLYEAAGETFQESMNQAARIGVNPDAEMFSDEALHRYKESAIGGGLLGAMFGGGLGGWKRSKGYVDPNAPAVPVDENGTTDILQPQPQQMSLFGDQPQEATGGLRTRSALPNTLGVTEMGAIPDAPLQPTSPDEAYAALLRRQRELGAQIIEAGREGAARQEAGLLEEASAFNSELHRLIAERAKVTETLAQFGDMPTNTDRLPGQMGFDFGPEQAPAAPAAQAAPAAPVQTTTGNAFVDAAQAQQSQQEQATVAAGVAAQQQRVLAKKAEYEAAKKDAAGFGIKGNKAVDVYIKVRDAERAGHITPQQAEDFLNEIAQSKAAKVDKDLASIVPQAQPASIVPQAQPASTASQGAGSTQPTPAPTTNAPANVSTATAPAPGPGPSSVGGGAVAQGGVAAAGPDAPANVGQGVAAGGAGAAVGKVEPAGPAKAGPAAVDLPSVVLGGSIDFAALEKHAKHNPALKDDPRILTAIRFALGVDRDGTRLPKPMSQQAAAAAAGLGNNSGERVSKAFTALGLTKDVRNKFQAASFTVAGEFTEDTDAGTPGPVVEDTSAEAQALLRDNGTQTISSVGGSGSNIDAPKTRLPSKKFYRTAVENEGGVEDWKDATLATIAAKAVQYVNDLSSRSAAAAVMAEASRRAKKSPAFASALAAQLDLEEKTRSNDVEVERSDESDTESDTEVAEGSTERAVDGTSGEGQRQLSGGPAALEVDAADIPEGDRRPASKPTVTVKRSRKIQKSEAPKFSKTAPEPGALASASPDDVLEFYAKTQKANLFPGAQVLDPEAAPGTETIYWGADSSFGPHRGVATLARVDEDGRFNVFLLHTQTAVVAKEGDPDGVLVEVSLFPVAGENRYILSVLGPEQGGAFYRQLAAKGLAEPASAADPDGYFYTRLTGIPVEDVFELLTEARRRLTRHLGGGTPSITFGRETGWNVAREDRTISAEVLERRFSMSASAGSTVASVKAEIAKLGIKDTNRRVTVVQSLSDLPADIQKSVSSDMESRSAQARVQAFVVNGRAYLVAANIAPGNARAVFLHEVGSHLGLENLLTAREFTRLAKKIVSWADQKDGSLESQLARKAIERAGLASTPDLDLYSEVIAYFIEEAVKAGVDPTAQSYKGQLAQWFASLMRALKEALRRLAMFDSESLTAQDIVDMAYGAAHLELQQEVDEDADVQFSMEVPQHMQGTPEKGIVAKTIEKLPEGLQPYAKAVDRMLRNAGRKVLTTAAFTDDLLDRAVSLGMDAAKGYKEQARARAATIGHAEQQILKIVTGYNNLPDNLKGKAGAVNRYLWETTTSEKWGFQPSWLNEKVDIDPAMAAKFKAMPPEARAVIEDMLRHGHETLVAKKKLVIDTTVSEYDILIAAETDPEKKATLEKDKARALKSSYGSLMRLAENKPYAPIKRFGSHVVMAKSAQYVAAERANDQAKMRELEGDERHYYVDFVDGEVAAAALRDTLSKNPSYASTVFREREALRDQLYGGSKTLKAISDLKARVESMPSNTERKKLLDTLQQLYLLQLGEDSARKSEMRRRKIAGDIDMIRSFETQGLADARFMGQIQYGQKLLEHMNEMREEIRKAGAPNAMSEVFNELQKRHLQAMDYEPTPWTDKATRMTSQWFLATSPAYYMQNATQPWMMSLPYMAAKHDYGKVAPLLTAAYKQLSIALKGTGMTGQLDFDALLGKGSPLSANEKKMLKTLLDGKRIDIGMANEIGQITADKGNKATDTLNKVDNGLRGMQTKLEAINRLSTALAAYRAEVAKSGHEKAVEYADEVIQRTHGDYSAWNAPRAFNTRLGKFMLQFRKYQLIQLSLMARMLNNSFSKADTPEAKAERAIARRALRNMLTQAFLVGGGKAMPIPFFLSAAFAAVFGDEDEPPEQVLRKMIGDEDIADVLLYGAFGEKFGGMGNMFSILPYTDIDLTSRKGVEEAGYALVAGPFGGLALRAADGIGLIQSGQPWKGWEQLLPKGISDFSRALREQSEGVTNRRGDQLLSEDEIGFLATLQQSLGIRPMEAVKRSARSDAVYDMTKGLKDESSEIKRMYVEAVSERDVEAMAEARNAWAELQARRVRQGFSRLPLSDLMRAPQEARKREKNTTGGVQYREDNERFVKAITER